MSNTGHTALPTGNNDTLDDDEWDNRESLDWVDTHVKRQNQCLWLTVVVLLVVAASYTIGGMSLANSDALEGEKYIADSGILADGFAGDKEQDLFEEHLDGNKNGKDWWKSHDKENPFGNQNAMEHGNDVLSQMRSNSTKPPKPFPGHQGGKNGFIHGKRPTKPVGGHSSTNHAPSGSTEGKASDAPLTIDVCDHSGYADWLSATVTLHDGIKYEVVEKIPHDHEAFLQGLTYADGTLWESNGLFGQSSVRILDPDTGKVLKSVKMPDEVFGEGMTYLNGKLYQITWKSHRGFIYNATTLDLIKEFKFLTTRNEGWGITWDPCAEEFVVTDGSANLHFWDKDTLQEERKVQVKRRDGRDAKNLNEIEWYRGKILANVWYEDVLLVIDPVTGTVDKEYDFSTIFPMQERTELQSDVFNGISVSADPDILYVSGKKWDRMFKVRLLV